MGSILSAISDDISAYEALCRRYGEAPVRSHGSPDPYGPHAEELKERAERDEPAREVMES